MPKPSAETPLPPLGPWVLEGAMAPVEAPEDRVQAYFVVCAALAAEPKGLTARQLARRAGLPDDQAPRMAKALEALVVSGDVKRSQGSPPRFEALPLWRSLSNHLRVRPAAGGVAREALEQAAVDYLEEPKALRWRLLTEAFEALVAGMPGWPEALRHEARHDAPRWLAALLGIRPPSHLGDAEDPLLGLQQECDRLRQDLTASRKLVDELEAALLQAQSGASEGGRKAELRARVGELEAENAGLHAKVAKLEGLLAAFEEELEDPAHQQFLSGLGRGELPDWVEEGELQRLRGLVADTKAERPIQLALARRLGEIYRRPTRFTRLSSQAFAKHAFDSVWRARAGGYRIVYGLRGDRPEVVVVDRRSEVYEEASQALRRGAKEAAT